METEEGSQLFETQKRKGHEKWAVKRGRVRQIYARDHVEVHPQKKKKVISGLSLRGGAEDFPWQLRMWPPATFIRK